jgi:hypothetical protein
VFVLEDRAVALKTRITALVRRVKLGLGRRFGGYLNVVRPLWLDPSGWQRVLTFFSDGRFPPLERQIDLVVGVNNENAATVRKWLAGHQGRSALLVLQHEGLKGADFGCDVFTQHELVPPGSDTAAAIAADWKSSFRSLCERLQHVRFENVVVAPDLLQEGLQSVYRPAEIARAARELLARGYRHVAVVLSGYTYLDGALIEEAKACGLAATGARALIARSGYLSRYQALTALTAWSKPKDWAAAYLRRIEPSLESPSEIIALGFSYPARAAQLEVVADDVSKLCRVDQLSGDAAEIAARTRMMVIPELTVADPDAVAETLEQLLEAWREDLAGRLTAGCGSWKQFGRYSFEAMEARLLGLEESILPMLKNLARLERLNAICKQSGPAKVVIDDPATCALTPEAPPCLHDKMRFIRFPLAWDASDAEANHKLALVMKQALDEERASRPVEGPELHVVIGVGLEEVTHVARWLSGLEGRHAVLLMRHDLLSGCQFGCDRFHDIDLIQTNSSLEEDVYRSCSEYRARRQAQLATITFLGLQLSLDFYRAVAAPVERLTILMRAAGLLFERGYSHIVIVVGAGNDYLGSLVLEGRACGVMRVNSAARRVVGGQVQADHAFSTPSLLKSLRQYAEGISQRAPFVNAPVKAVVVGLSSEPAYLRNGMAVIAALVEREKRLLLVVPWREGFAWTDETGVEAATLDPGGAVAARNPDELNRAADAFLRALHGLAQAAVAERPPLSWRDLGKATSDFHDLHSAGRDVIGNALRRHLTLIDRLDEIMSTVKPEVIYKFPSGATIVDGSLLGVAAKYGIRQVASVFLSASASFRNLDRTAQDIITVLGQAQVEILKSNIAANLVVAAGQPEMDLLMRSWPPDKARQYARRVMPAWDGSNRIVLVVTSNFDAENEPRWVRELCRHAMGRGDAHVLVKLHPATPIEVYRAKLACDDSEVSLVADPEIAPYMEIASVVVTDVSHAGKIAAYLNKPLMVVNISGTAFPYHRYDEDGVAIGAFTLEQVGPTLDRILAGQTPPTRRTEFVQREFTSDDNRASDRIAELVLSLCRSSERQDIASAP